MWKPKTQSIVLSLTDNYAKCRRRRRQLNYLCDRFESLVIILEKAVESRFLAYRLDLSCYIKILLITNKVDRDNLYYTI